MSHDQLAAIYARIPEVQCKGLCQDACGPIGMSRLEYQALRDRVGDRIEGRPLPRHLHALTPIDEALRRNVLSQDSIMLKTRREHVCPLLNADGQCAAYAQRPAICRLWGAVRSMTCPFGCRPKRFLTNEESHSILHSIDELARTTIPHP